ncbi:uncharacterized protein LOC121425997 [Lytechinus variegatus]|uniref:uncharacterized protein LOC121425997 n=1 Tax=Lytechinus variegatus TaxID=7654 RepID=UPI001BB1F69F|nr:uncharacterized protein LOC121425997 [Lytechinus variegatus]
MSSCLNDKKQPSVRKNLRSLLYSVAAQLTSDDLHSLLFLTAGIINSKQDKERIRSAGSTLDLFEILMERDALNDQNVNLLFDLLSKIRRFDVAKKARDKWDEIKTQLHPDDPDPCHNGPDPSRTQHHSQSVRELNHRGIVKRRKRYFEGRPSQRQDYRGQHPTAMIDWADKEVQKLLQEPFRPRSRPITRDYHILRHTSYKNAMRDFLTQSIAAGSYYCPMDMVDHKNLFNYDGIEAENLNHCST